MTDWSAEDIALLTKEWPHKSARDIAAMFAGKFSRGAVIGKAYRLKLPRKKVVAKPPEPRKQKLSRLILSRVFHAKPRIEAIPMEGTAVHILDLRWWHCREVRGEPHTQLYCGDHVAKDSSWCPVHKKKNTQKATGQRVHWRAW